MKIIFFCMSYFISCILSSASLGEEKESKADFKTILAEEVREKKSITPPNTNIEWGNIMLKHGIVPVSTKINGKNEVFPAIPLTASGILMLPNVVFPKKQKLFLNVGGKSEKLYPFVSSENNYTILKSKLVNSVKIKYSREIDKGQNIISLPLLCEYNCEVTYGVVLKSGPENVYPTMHYKYEIRRDPFDVVFNGKKESYEIKKDFMGPIFNENEELIGFNSIMLNNIHVDNEFNREVYFLLSINELEKYLKVELGYSPFDN